MPTRRALWAELLQRVFEVEAFSCPRCGGRMRVLAAITEADVAKRMLACLDLPTRAPPLEMRRPSDRTDILGSAFEFDQSTPNEWDVGA